MNLRSCDGKGQFECEMVQIPILPCQFFNISQIKYLLELLDECVHTLVILLEITNQNVFSDSSKTLI